MKMTLCLEVIDQNNQTVELEIGRAQVIKDIGRRVFGHVSERYSLLGQSF